MWKLAHNELVLVHPPECPEAVIQFIESTDRAAVNHMLNMRKYIDLLIPRGSESLVRLVAEKATMPAITGGVGVSHTYIDSDADLEKALAIQS